MGNYKDYDTEGPMSEKRISLEERLKKHPYLKSRFESILDIAEDRSGELDKADDAEQCLIDEIRHLGKEVLHDWAIEKEKKKVEDLREKKDGIKNHSKKKFGGTRHSEK